MKTDWAEENLQTIRTLMERSAVYRRALAPIMLLSGMLGVAAAIAGLLVQLNSFPEFLALWFSTATLATVGAFLIARRQALKDKEVFWSPPTRRVAQSLLPPFLAGLFFGVFPAFMHAPPEAALLVALVWILFYGCALHAAGFFMPRGIRVFGWLFIASGCVLFCAFMADLPQGDGTGYYLMGFFFGVLHLAYGAYLYLTEKGKNAA